MKSTKYGVVKVQFKSSSQTYSYRYFNTEFEKGDYVVVLTSTGYTIAKVREVVDDCPKASACVVGK